MMHPNRILVESGCYFGDGIRNALFAGFQEVHSIELSSKYYNYCKSLFKDNDNVLLYEGDSGKILFEVIKDINEPITFWLDGHCSLGDTAKGEGMTPILQELEQIKKHHIKTHTILIDDVRQFGTWNFDFISLEQILNKILEINSNYIFSFDDGFCSNDILVAEIR